MRANDMKSPTIDKNICEPYNKISSNAKNINDILPRISNNSLIEENIDLFSSLYNHKHILIRSTSFNRIYAPKLKSIFKQEVFNPSVLSSKVSYESLIVESKTINYNSINTSLNLEQKIDNSFNPRANNWIDSVWVKNTNKFIIDLSTQEQIILYLYNKITRPIINEYCNCSLDTKYVLQKVIHNESSWNKKYPCPLFFSMYNVLKTKSEELNNFIVDKNEMVQIPNSVDYSTLIKNIIDSNSPSQAYPIMQMLIKFKPFNGTFLTYVLDAHISSINDIIDNAPVLTKPMVVYTVRDKNNFIEKDKLYNNPDFTVVYTDLEYVVGRFENKSIARLLLLPGSKCLLTSGISNKDTLEIVLSNKNMLFSVNVNIPVPLYKMTDALTNQPIADVCDVSKFMSDANDFIVLL